MGGGGGGWLPGWFPCGGGGGGGVFIAPATYFDCVTTCADLVVSV